MASTINPLAPETIHSYLKIIEDCLYFGPRIAVSAFKMFRKTARLLRLDIPSCAAVIALLGKVDKKMSFQEIVDTIKGLDPTKVFPQLQEIEGVLFLEKDPAGLALEENLQAEIKQFI